jgi:hypothetical protein
MAQDTLQRLYKADPEAKGAVEGAAGYAAFSNTGVKIHRNQGRIDGRSGLGLGRPCGCIN